MLPNIKRILYTTSLGDHTRTVFRYTVSLARTHGAKITILHVVEPLTRASDFLMESYMPRQATADTAILAAPAGQSQQALARIRARVARFYAEELGPGSHAALVENIVVDSGSPPDMIVRRADILEADLLVVGRDANGGGWKTVLRGSTSRQVMQLTTRPVLVVAHGAEERWGERHG